MKALLQKALNTSGYQLKKIQQHRLLPNERPVGDMQCLLEDLRKRGLQCSFIMDVGANRGQWSRMAKNIFTEAEFCLIEPQIEMFNSLQNFCDEFENSFFVNAGAGACKEAKTLTVWDDLLGSSLLPVVNCDLKKNNKQREIEIITIDSIIAKRKVNAPELIKLDIQGFELEALKGAEQTFGVTEVYILEVSFFAFERAMPVFADVINFMLERNYVVYDFAGFLRRPYDGALGQCDICFVKKNGFLRRSNKWE